VAFMGGMPCFPLPPQFEPRPQPQPTPLLAYVYPGLWEATTSQVMVDVGLLLMVQLQPMARFMMSDATLHHALHEATVGLQAHCQLRGHHQAPFPNCKSCKRSERLNEMVCY